MIFDILKENSQNLELKLFPCNFGPKLPNRITKRGNNQAVIIVNIQYMPGSEQIH